MYGLNDSGHLCKVLKKAIMGLKVYEKFDRQT